MSSSDMVQDSRWPVMADQVRALPAGLLSRDDLLTPEFRLDEEGDLQTYWIPFERLNRTARVAIVGLTPGWFQMREAFTAARDALADGVTEPATVLELVESAAGFAGAMRTNMVKMLDTIGLAAALGIQTCGELFAARIDLLHGTSALRYPVFVRGENYGGQAPSIARSPMLTRQVLDQLGPELAAVPHALIIPLGKAAESALHTLIENEQMEELRCLSGFPHPSGGNGHRVSQFQRNQATLSSRVHAWASQTIMSAQPTS